MTELNGSAEKDQNLMEAWLRAEQAGDREKSYELLTDLIAARQALWTQSEPPGPMAKDYFLLDRLVSLLQARRFHDKASHVCDAACQYGRQQNETFTVLHFTVRKVISSIALLELDTAATVLCDILHLPHPEMLLDREIPINAAEQISIPNVSSQDLHIVKVNAILALAHYQAACGKLTAAQDTVRHTYALVEKQPSPSVSLAELRIWQGELLLDQGRFMELDELLRPGKGEDEEISLKRQILLAQRSQLLGRFSDAEQILQDIVRRRHAIQGDSVWESAAWQRIHALGALNRLDEAEVQLQELSLRKWNDESGNLDEVQALLNARRAAASIALDLPPPSRQFLVFGDYDDIPPERGDAVDLNSLGGQIRRKDARVRVDYSRLFNQALLSLHRGDLQTALLLCMQLDAWVRTIESALIAAKQLHLWALVQYYAEDMDAAMDAAQEAYAAYERLDMLGEQWAMSRVIGWILHRHGAPQEVRDQNARRTMLLQEQLSSKLAATDRGLYGLNKWFAVDENISRLCRQLDTNIIKMQQRRFLWWPMRSRLRRVTTAGIRSIINQRSRSVPAENSARPVNLSKIDTDTQDAYSLALENIRRRTAAAQQDAFSGRLIFRWLPSDTAIFFYVVLPDRLELFLITNRICRKIEIFPQTTRPDLWQKVRTTLGLLRRAKTWSPEGRIKDLSTRLGLEAAVRHLPERIRKIIIVPDDILAHVPFSALALNHEPLMVHYAPAVMPVFRWTVKNPLKNGLALGVAVTTDADNDELPSIPDADQELEEVRSRWKYEWKALVDAEAKVDAVRQFLKLSKLVHFSCHGEFFLEKPDRSGLRLSDNWFTIADIYGLDLQHLSLVVMTACWGANATVLPGGIHVGMPFAFVDQGCASVIACLWEVPQESSLPFCQHLYPNLFASEPHVALSTTQKQWWQTAPPSHWCGYVSYCKGVVPTWPARWLLRAFRAMKANRQNKHKAGGVGALNL